MDTIDEYIDYFENLIEGFTHEAYRNLRNRPEVLDKIKGFYNLCFEKMAEGLNELVYQTTGEVTTIFNQPVKLGDVQFHFNKLGEMAQKANTFEEMAFEIGGATNESDALSYMSSENGCKLTTLTNRRGVCDFLFPVLVNSHTTDYVETIISYFRSLFASKKSLSNLDFGKKYAELISIDFRPAQYTDYFYLSLGPINQDRHIDKFKDPTSTELTNFVEILVNLMEITNNFIVAEFIRDNNLALLPFVQKGSIKLNFTPTRSASCYGASSYFFEFSDFKFELSNLKIDTDLRSMGCLSTRIECEGRITIERDTAIFKGTSIEGFYG